MFRIFQCVDIVGGGFPGKKTIQVRHGPPFQGKLYDVFRAGLIHRISFLMPFFYKCDVLADVAILQQVLFFSKLF
jgi:hypothetical protein